MPDTKHDHHHHGITEAEADRANVGVIGIILAVTVIVMSVTSYMLWAYFEREAHAINYTQVLSKPSAELDQLRAEEAKLLDTAGVVNAEAGIYRVPIQTGMELFLKEARARREAGKPQRIQATAAPAEEAAPPAGEGQEAGSQ